MGRSLKFSEQEVASRQANLDTLAIGQQLFATDGLLVLENAFPAPMVTRLCDALVSRYAASPKAEEWPEAVMVGDRRYMFSVVVEPPFSSPDLYANELVLSFITGLLGQGFTLNTFGAVVAQPGSENQHVHRDHPMLFGDDALDTRLPSYMVQMLVPLVDLNSVNGTTRVWRGSHCVPEAEARQMESTDIEAPVGSCILMDYRLLHGGTENRSERSRPLLYLAYRRPWFRDFVNFKNHRAMSITEEEFGRVPEEYRPWFENGRHDV